MKVLYTFLLIAACAAVGYCVSGSTIAAKADRHVGSTKWSKAGSYRTGRNTWKCNLFVADVLKEAGGDVPHRWLWYSPIGANEWANPNSNYLTRDRCWTRVTSPSLGDVAATGGHVGIVTGSSRTTSAAEFSVVKNNWGFRAGQSPTLWRYRVTC